MRHVRGFPASQGRTDDGARPANVRRPLQEVPAGRKPHVLRRLPGRVPRAVHRAERGTCFYFVILYHYCINYLIARCVPCSVHYFKYKNNESCYDISNMFLPHVFHFHLFLQPSTSSINSLEIKLQE